jgi:hypothetical protein
VPFFNNLRVIYYNNISIFIVIIRTIPFVLMEYI